MTDGDAYDGADVEELKATIDGLTSELLDLQERVRQLEAAVYDEPDTRETKSVEELFAQADGGTDVDEELLDDVETIGDDIIIG